MNQIKETTGQAIWGKVKVNGQSSLLYLQSYRSISLTKAGTGFQLKLATDSLGVRA